MSDALFMQQALALAATAAQQGEVPVAAVVVLHGKVIASASNAPIGSHDPTAHAEILALRAAAQLLGNYRLAECELFVTLEPCSMCSGAMLHARLKRVVFGAPEPKTGAAGSVLNLFAQPQLNHQTALQGGVLAEQSQTLMQEFFRQRRTEKRRLAKTNHPLRDDALRTPDSAFEKLANYPWQAHYLSDLPSLAGLRMHYLDEAAAQPSAQKLTYLCLHGDSTWGYLYRHMLPIWLAGGQRVVVPDLIGFGKSDKPKKAAWHSFAQQRQTLIELIERLDLSNIVLVVDGCDAWDGLLGLSLPRLAPERYRGLLRINTPRLSGAQQPPLGVLSWREWCEENPSCYVANWYAQTQSLMPSGQSAAFAAPFPDRGHTAALLAFKRLMATTLDADSAAFLRQTEEFWRCQWTGQTLIASAAQDPKNPKNSQNSHKAWAGMPQRAQNMTVCTALSLPPSTALEGQQSYAIYESAKPDETIARAALEFFQPQRQ